MALVVNCPKCGRQTSRSLSDSSDLCDNCNGNNVAAAAEEERWRSLSTDEKLNELRMMVLSLQRHASGPIADG
jgi:hypothetical protein